MEVVHVNGKRRLVIWNKKSEWSYETNDLLDEEKVVWNNEYNPKHQALVEVVFECVEG